MERDLNSPEDPNLSFQEHLSTAPMSLLSAIGIGLAGTTLGFMIASGENNALTITFGVFTLFMTLVLVAFSRLNLSINPESIKISFRGIINKTIPHNDVSKIEVGLYDWREFVGWGLRWSDGGDIAYSIFGIDRCLRIHLKDDSIVVVSCQNTAKAQRLLRRHLGESAIKITNKS